MSPAPNAQQEVRRNLACIRMVDRVRVGVASTCICATGSADPPCKRYPCCHVMVLLWTIRAQGLAHLRYFDHIPGLVQLRRCVPPCKLVTYAKACLCGYRRVIDLLQCMLKSLMPGALNPSL